MRGKIHHANVVSDCHGGRPRLTEDCPIWQIREGVITGARPHLLRRKFVPTEPVLKR